MGALRGLQLVITRSGMPRPARPGSRRAPAHSGRARAGSGSAPRPTSPEPGQVARCPIAWFVPGGNAPSSSPHRCSRRRPRCHRLEGVELLSAKPLPGGTPLSLVQVFDREGLDDEQRNREQGFPGERQVGHVCRKRCGLDLQSVSRPLSRSPCNARAARRPPLPWLRCRQRRDRPILPLRIAWSFSRSSEPVGERFVCHPR